jgi:hypothetical protein
VPESELGIVEVQLARVVESIATIDAPVPSATNGSGAEPRAPVDPAEAGKLIRELSERLEEDDMAATEVAERLGALGLDGSALPLLRSLEKAVAGYDFDTAREELGRLAATLELPLR